MKPVWNKGNYNVILIDGVNQIISSNPGLTPGEIYQHLGDGYEYTYKGFLKHLAKARKNGIVNSSYISEGRGGKRKSSGAKFKFAVGDKVRIAKNNRTPEYLRAEIKRLDIPRTIIAIFSVCEPPQRRADTLYYLGNNRMGGCNSLESYGFRTRQLIPYVKGNVGRPKRKRHYNRNLGKGSVIKGNSPLGGDKSPILNYIQSPSISCVNSGIGVLV